MVYIKGGTVFHLIQATRLWNAKHGGVYVPVDKGTPANALLETEERDIRTPSGVELTLVNPAYMTRQLSELLEGSDVEVRLTSLKPLNPVNKADLWEQKALQWFEEDSSRVRAELVGEYYRYIEPLVTRDECMACHRHQGYEVGDVRGGMSLKFPRSDIDGLVSGLKDDVKRAHVGLFFILWIVGFIVTLVFHRLNASLIMAAAKEKQLSDLAMTDELTRILNRRSLLQAYERALSLSKRKHWPLSVMMLDIDHFKQINDRYGHQMGDEVLARFARAVSSTLRDSDVIGRYGGEEFLVILQDEGHEGALIAADRIRKVVQEMRFDTQPALSVRVSIGIVERTHYGNDQAEALIKAADKALYQAKSNGRDQACLAMPEASAPL